MTQPVTTFRNGFNETSFVLYDSPVPSTAAEVVWVIDKGMLKNVEISTKIVEVIRVAAALA